MEDLSSKLDDGSYDNEYDFQLELFELINSANDQHFSYAPDITQVFGFQRGLNLFSLSMDGTSVPEIYTQLDVRALASANLTNNYTASPVTSINGEPVEDFLRAFADRNAQAQDPDAKYNLMLYNLPRAKAAGVFASSAFYQGDETVYEFKNGSTRRDPNLAVTSSDFSGVVDGQSFFDKFCVGNPPSLLTASGNFTSNPVTSASVSAPAPPPPTTTVVSFTAVPQQTYLPAPASYPEPWVISNDYTVACYFPADQAEVAVLAIPDFGPETNLAELQFTNTVRACLATAQQQEKTRLIVDLRGNGGGTVGLGFDVFKQLFPSVTPYGGTNFRAFDLFNDIGQIVTDFYSDVGFFDRPPLNGSAVYSSIFNANDGLDARLDDYDSWQEFYGPVTAYDAEFTNLLRYNLSDLYDVPSSTEISGYGNLTTITPAQVFEAQDIVLVQDGICASTCAVFSEFMKSQAQVQQIVFGGRAQTGPMQGVGGVKGANVFGATYLSGLVNEGFSLASPARQAELSERYAVDIETFPYAAQRVGRDPENGELAAQVNIRNNIREGDDSLTPLQFVYEAADCRLFYTPEMILDQSLVWKAAYEARWGDGQCVEGSTGQQSSGFGTDYFPGSNDTESDSDPDSSVGPPSEVPTNGAGKLHGGIAALGMFVALTVLL